MNKIYWEKFMKTGSITDYLMYRENVAMGLSPRPEEVERKYFESDYIDRNGPVDDAGGRI